MVRSSFLTTWKIAIEIKREGKKKDKSNNSFIVKKQKMSLHQQFNLRNLNLRIQYEKQEDIHRLLVKCKEK